MTFQRDYSTLHKGLKSLKVIYYYVILERSFNAKLKIYCKYRFIVFKPVIDYILRLQQWASPSAYAAGTTVMVKPSAFFSTLPKEISENSIKLSGEDRSFACVLIPLQQFYAKLNPNIFRCFTVRAKHPTIFGIYNKFAARKRISMPEVFYCRFIYMSNNRFAKIVFVNGHVQ